MLVAGRIVLLAVYVAIVVVRDPARAPLEVGAVRGRR